VNKELSRPVANTPPVGFAGRLKFYGRLVIDFQVGSVYRDLRATLPTLRGDVLDVGCGMSPYRFLLSSTTSRYVGIDIFDAEKFDNANTDVVRFDGQQIPFPCDHFDAVICTEVLEHVARFQNLVDEMHRVMKRGARAIITVPWSARYHYIPDDYFRYTPSALAIIFGGFAKVDITARGTDVSVIASKLVVLWWRNLLPRNPLKWVLVPLWVLALPVLVVIVMVAQLCTIARVGDTADPLGYTIVVTK